MFLQKLHFQLHTLPCAQIKLIVLSWGSKSSFKHHWQLYYCQSHIISKTCTNFLSLHTSHIFIKFLICHVLDIFTILLFIEKFNIDHCNYTVTKVRPYSSYFLSNNANSILTPSNRFIISAFGSKIFQWYPFPDKWLLNYSAFTI